MPICARPTSAGQRVDHEVLADLLPLADLHAAHVLGHAETGVLLVEAFACPRPRGSARGSSGGRPGGAGSDRRSTRRTGRGRAWSCPAPGRRRGPAWVSRTPATSATSSLRPPLLPAGGRFAWAGPVAGADRFVGDGDGELLSGVGISRTTSSARLVLAEPLERRVAHPTVGRPLGEPHLRDQRGLHPVRASEARGRRREGRGVLFERAESLVQVPQRLVGEAGADLARVDAVARPRRPRPAARRCRRASPRGRCSRRSRPPARGRTSS